MGIPSYFSYIIRNYKGIIQSLDFYKQKKEIKHLFMDCNSIIYDCVHSFEIMPDDKMVIQKVIEKIQEYIKLTNPSNTIYIAFDGVAPVAKMEQQRSRRYKTDFLSKILINKDESMESKFNTCKITPGTKFMKQLSKDVSNFFVKTNYPNIKNVIVSSSNEIGEGEHKIFKYIRENPCIEDDIVIYGLDADLFMLAIFHHSYFQNCFIFREAPEFIKSSILDNSQNINNSENYMINIEVLCKAILSNMGSTNSDDIYDYSFMCFLLGNDFLPHFPALNIRTHGIQALLDIYNKIFKNQPEQNMVCLKTKQINWKYVGLFVKELSNLENDFLVQEYNFREKYDKWKWTEPKTLKEKEEFIQNFPIMYRQDEKYINPNSVGWEERYYRILFHTNDTNVSNICKNYLEGLEWVFKYYIGESIDWRWKYNYHYGPLFKDLGNMIPKKNNFNYIKKCNKPVSSDVQLLYVLPKSQNNLLMEKIIKSLEKSKLEIYPSRIDFQWAFCRYLWEGHIILPNIDVVDLERNI